MLVLDSVIVCNSPDEKAGWLNSQYAMGKHNNCFDHVKLMIEDAG